jgi:hypothetical protein
MNKGDPVIFTSDRIGCLDSLYDRGFNEHIVNAGDRGLYYWPHHYLADQGWHICTHKVDENSFVFVPVHESMFKAAS